MLIKRFRLLAIITILQALVATIETHQEQGDPYGQDNHGERTGETNIY